MCIWRHLEGFFMQYFTKRWLRSACFSATLFFALNITGCGTSDDVSGPPSVVNAGIYNSTAVEGADDLEFVVSLAEASMAAVSMVQMQRLSRARIIQQPVALYNLRRVKFENSSLCLY
jgi:hypothetical protein